MNDRVKKQTPKIKIMFQLLFEKYLRELETGNQDSDIEKEFLPVYPRITGTKPPSPPWSRTSIAGRPTTIS